MNTNRLIQIARAELERELFTGLRKSDSIEADIAEQGRRERRVFELSHLLTLLYKDQIVELEKENAALKLNARYTRKYLIAG